MTAKPVIGNTPLGRIGRAGRGCGSNRNAPSRRCSGGSMHAAARLAWGGRRGSHPRPLDPHSRALPLSYIHHGSGILAGPRGIATCRLRPVATGRCRCGHRVGHGLGANSGLRAQASRPLQTGAPGRNRTCNHRLRRPVLYPVELRARRPGQDTPGPGAAGGGAAARTGRGPCRRRRRDSRCSARGVAALHADRPASRVRAADPPA